MNQNESDVYDLAIIGGGPGGYVAAIHAAQLNLRTILIEAETVGGTCLNRGCVPTKALLHSGEILDTMRHAEKFGITVGEPGFDLQKLYAYKDKTVKTLRSGVAGLLRHHSVEVVRGIGRIKGKHSIVYTSEVGEKQVTAKNMIIATGSEPAIPPIPGLREMGYWTSNDLLESNLPLPKSMTIIGGGVIGVECATILHDFGVQVRIVEMMTQLLPRMDSEIAELLKKELVKKGVEIYTDTAVMSLSESGGRKVCRIQTGEGEKEIISDEIFVAIGRKSRTEDIGLESLSLDIVKGCIPVNEKQQTKLPNVYAVGDCTGGWMLAHAASAQGIIAVDHILGKINYTRINTIPACVYTRPEIGSVGMTAKEAEKQGYTICEGYFPMKADSKAVITGDTAGFVKIVTNKKTGAVLGGHIVGPRATDIITEIALAIASELTIEEISSTVHPHPTFSEAIMEAAHDTFGHAVHSISRREIKQPYKIKL
ncbi:MAG: dihydrolipoyl dehydrogenase [Bacteroidetes bacterium]|nr:dihydrolipoyl dehydrogenase [Bacteroidota bacterium]